VLSSSYSQGFSFKQSLQQIQGTSIKENLNKFLVKHRVTLYAVTEVAPIELLMGRHRLDLSKTVDSNKN